MCGAFTATPTRGLVAFSVVVADEKCVCRTPPVSVSHEVTANLSSTEHRFEIPRHDFPVDNRRVPAVIEKHAKKLVVVLPNP